MLFKLFINIIKKRKIFIQQITFILMNKDVIRVIYSIIFGIAASIIITTILEPSQIPAYQVIYPLLETEEGIGPVVGILIFFISLLTPIPKKKQKLMLVIRSLLISAFITFIVLIHTIKIESVRNSLSAGEPFPFASEIILFILLSAGLILYSKNR